MQPNRGDHPLADATIAGGQDRAPLVTAAGELEEEIDTARSEQESGRITFKSGAAARPLSCERWRKATTAVTLIGHVNAQIALHRLPETLMQLT